MTKAPAKKDVMHLLEWMLDQKLILGWTWDGMQGGNGECHPAKRLPSDVDASRKAYLISQALGYVDLDNIARRYQSYCRNAKGVAK